MKKQILIEQMDERVRKGLAVLIELYGRLVNGNITEDECRDLVDTTNCLSIIFKAMVDIHNGNITQYEDLMYRFAKDIEIGCI